MAVTGPSGEWPRPTGTGCRAGIPHAEALVSGLTLFLEPREATSRLRADMGGNRFALATSLWLLWAEGIGEVNMAFQDTLLRSWPSSGSK